MIGDIAVDILHAGPLALDGGAMFGVIPKVLWETKMPPDERNRIGMAMNVLLVRTGGTNILLDTGAGDKEDEKFMGQYGLQSPLLDGELSRFGLGPADIHVVVNTHLHFDHAGGNTRRGEAGEILPAFPNARYLVQRQEYEDALASHERNRASYLAHNYVPLVESGQMELLDGETEIASGVRTYPLPGHTLGLQGLFIESRGDKALAMTDCAPTSHHVPVPWIMAYDLHPMTTLETKKRVLPVAAAEGWILFFEHDPSVKAARVEAVKAGVFRAVPLEP